MTPSRQPFPRVPRHGPIFRDHPYRLSHPSPPWVQEVQARLERQQARWVLAAQPHLGGLWGRVVRLHLATLLDLAVPLRLVAPPDRLAPVGQPLLVGL